MNTTKYIYIFIGLLFLGSCESNNIGDEQETLKQLWNYEYPGEPEGLSLAQLAPEPIREDYIIISPDRFYSCLDQKTGKLIWKKQLPDNAWVSKNELLHDGSLVFSKLHKQNKIQALDIEDGTLLWEQTNISGDFFDYVNDALNNSQLYLAGDDSVIYQYSKSGQYRRELKLQHFARSILHTNGILYISQAWRPEGSEHAAGRIVAYDSETFEKQWEYETSQGGFYYGPLIYRDGRIYAGTTSGPSTFVALNATSGDVIWKKDGQVAYKYIVENDTVYINESLGLVALDARNGQELWSYQFTGDGQDNIAYLNGYLYHSHGSALYILDANNGEIVYTEPRSPDGSPFGLVAAADGQVFAQSDYHLYAYEAWK